MASLVCVNQYPVLTNLKFWSLEQKKTIWPTQTFIINNYCSLHCHAYLHRAVSVLEYGLAILLIILGKTNISLNQSQSSCTHWMQQQCPCKIDSGDSRRGEECLSAGCQALSQHCTFGKPDYTTSDILPLKSVNLTWILTLTLRPQKRTCSAQ